MAQILQQLTEFIGKCSRVISVMRKPTNEEFKIIAQASGIGLLLIGFLGFAVSIIFRFGAFNLLFGQ